LIIKEAFRRGDVDFFDWKIPKLKIGFTRLIAGMIMHVIVSAEI
jgi:hypothetical protein